MRALPRRRRIGRARLAAVSLAAAGALALLLPAVASASTGHGGGAGSALPVLPIGSIFSDVLGSVAGFGKDIVKTIFSSILTLFFGGSWKVLLHPYEIVEWLIGLPGTGNTTAFVPFAGSTAGGAFGALVKDTQSIGLGLLPLALVNNTVHLVSGGVFTRPRDHAHDFGKVFMAACAILAWPWLFGQAIDIANIVTLALLHAANANDNLWKTLGAYFATAWAGGFLDLLTTAFLIATALLLVGLIVMKIVLMIVLAFLLVIGPIAIAFYPFEFLSRVLMLFGSVFLALAMVPLGWAVLFALFTAFGASVVGFGNFVHAGLIGGRDEGHVRPDLLADLLLPRVEVAVLDHRADQWPRRRRDRRSRPGVLRPRASQPGRRAAAATVPVPALEDRPTAAGSPAGSRASARSPRILGEAAVSSPALAAAAPPTPDMASAARVSRLRPPRFAASAAARPQARPRPPPPAGLHRRAPRRAVAMLASRRAPWGPRSPAAPAPGLTPYALAARTSRPRRTSWPPAAALSPPPPPRAARATPPRRLRSARRSRGIPPRSPATPAAPPSNGATPAGAVATRNGDGAGGGGSNGTAGADVSRAAHAALNGAPPAPNGTPQPASPGPRPSAPAPGGDPRQVLHASASTASTPGASPAAGSRAASDAAPATPRLAGPSSPAASRPAAAPSTPSSPAQRSAPAARATPAPAGAPSKASAPVSRPGQRNGASAPAPVPAPPATGSERADAHHRRTGRRRPSRPLRAASNRPAIQHTQTPTHRLQ